MPYAIDLPLDERTPHTLCEPRGFGAHDRPFTSRVAFAAAHVVAAPSPILPREAGEGAVDWEATLAYRRYLWSYGFAVAEAMDTAQRGMGLDWPLAQALIRRSIAEAKAAQGVVACGAGTDHLPPSPDRTLDEVIAAYESQVGFVEGLGGRVILMASRALAACARGRTITFASTTASCRR